MAARNGRVTKFAKLSICLGSLLAAAYFLFGPRFWLDNVYGRDASETKLAVLDIVPVGSRIDTAKTVMEQKGFSCRMMYNQRYSEDDVGNSPRQIEHPPADILWCDSGDRSYRGIVITKRWQIIFEAKDDAVVRVAAGVGLTGL
jgi:hypothetical protein